MLRQTRPGFSAFQLDAVELLRQQEDESVDCCITDPAYQSLEKHRKKGTTTRLSKSKSSSNAWFQIFGDERYPALFTELYRVLKPQRHSYIFCDETTADVIKPVARDAGFWVWKSMLWVKTVRTSKVLEEILKPFLDRGMIDVQFGSPSTRGPLRALMKQVRQIDHVELMSRLTRAGNGYHGAGACERILFLEKRTKPQGWPQLDPTGKGLNGRNRAMKDVLYAPRVGLQDYHGPDGLYPTEKPLSIVETLLDNSTTEGQLMIDPFAGSGVLGEAAMKLGRQVVLGDLSDRSMETIERRMLSYFEPERSRS